VPPGRPGPRAAMRGSAAPSFDASAKYGVPALHAAHRRARAPADAARGFAYGAPTVHGASAGAAVQHTPKAPLFSPAVEPQRSCELLPPPLSDGEAPALAPADSGAELRAPRDAYPGQLPHLAPGREAPDGSAGEDSPPRHAAAAGAALAGGMPKDVVTSMALALGAPARPARASPTQGPERRAAMMSEVWTAAPASWAARQGDSVQGFGRVCDLLFFGDELPVPLALVEVLPATGPGARPCLRLFLCPLACVLFWGGGRVTRCGSACRARGQQPWPGQTHTALARRGKSGCSRASSTPFA